MGQPGVDVLTHSGQDQPEEPAFAASGARLKQAKVKLLALDGTLGAGATVFVELPQVTIPGDEGMQAVVFLGIGVDDAAIG